MTLLQILSQRPDPGLAAFLVNASAIIPTMIIFVITFMMVRRAGFKGWPVVAVLSIAVWIVAWLLEFPTIDKSDSFNIYRITWGSVLRAFSFDLWLGSLIGHFVTQAAKNRIIRERLEILERHNKKEEATHGE